MAVDDDERVVVGRDGAVAAHGHADACAGLAAGLLEVDARHLGLHGLHGVRRSHRLDVGSLNAGHRTGQVLLALHAVADDDHFVQVLALFLEDDLDDRTAGHADFLRSIADVGDAERTGLRNVLEREVTVHVGHRTLLGADNYDIGTNDGLARFVGDGTTHGLGLGKCHHSTHCEGSEREG